MEPPHNLVICSERVVFLRIKGIIRCIHLECTMKLFLLLSIAGIFVACDPYGFGFKNNPAHVLDAVLLSISNQDDVSFLEVSDREALCVYGNKEGINYLHEKVQVNSENLKLTWKTTDTYYKVPEFVGFWSYFNSRFLIDIKDKKSKEIYAQVVVDCNYGHEEKSERLRNLPPKKYQKKDCRLIKIIPLTFQPLPVPAKCDVLKVSMN